LAFTTFSQDDDSVSFLVFNDLHGRSQFMKDVCKNIDLKGIDMVFFNGDMSTAINSEEQLFTDFIDASVELFASRIPIVFNRGNHETRGTYADYVMNYFPKETGQVYQLLNVGKAAFLILDCGEDKPDSDIEYSGLANFDAYREEEARWLKQAVKLDSYKGAPVKMVILHMPPLVSNWHGNLHLTETILPLLNDANVTAMLSGHTHRYSFNKPEPGKINFPVLVNSNNAVIRCDIINGKVKATIISTDGAKPLEIQLN
jgi:Icc-related predicted phosphoesterase